MRLPAWEKANEAQSSYGWFFISHWQFLFLRLLWKLRNRLTFPQRMLPEFCCVRVRCHVLFLLANVTCFDSWFLTIELGIII